MAAELWFTPVGLLAGFLSGLAADVYRARRRRRAAEPAPAPAPGPGGGMPTVQLLRLIADARDDYSHTAGSDENETLLAHEAAMLRLAARIVEGDRSTVWAWVPTDMLTDDMERPA